MFSRINMSSLLSLGLVVLLFPKEILMDNDDDFKSLGHSVEAGLALPLGAIVGIAIGAIVLLILCCVCILRCCCGCCQRDRTYVQTTIVNSQPVPNQTFINLSQPPYPPAQPNPSAPYLQAQIQAQQGYSPLVSDPPPQYIPKE